MQRVQKPCGTSLGNRWLAACGGRMDCPLTFPAMHALAIVALMFFLLCREINIREALLLKDGRRLHL